MCIRDRYYVKGRQVEVNVISDRMYLNSMNNCDAGIYNFAVAPNGRIYICPAFYYDEPDNYVGDIYAGIDYNKVKQCKLGCSPICMPVSYTHLAGMATASVFMVDISNKGHYSAV